MHDFLALKCAWKVVMHDFLVLKCVRKVVHARFSRSKVCLEGSNARFSRSKVCLEGSNARFSRSKVCSEGSTCTILICLGADVEGSEKDSDEDKDDESSDIDEDVHEQEMHLGDILSAVRNQVQHSDSPISFDGESTPSVDQTSVTWKKPLLVCGICLESEDSEKDEILECDNCGITVHEGCYGDIDESEADTKSISDGPTEPWFCEPCKAGLSEAPICELCPNIGGIYKQTDTGKWVHLICALYTPCIGFRDVSRLQTVVLEDIKSAMWANKECMFCVDDNFSRTGVCISCDAGMCKSIFHVTCAQRNGFLSDIPNKDDTANDEYTEFADLLFAHCKLHSVKLEVRKRRSSWLAFQSHVSKFIQDEQDKERIRNALARDKHQYLEYRRYIIPSKQPPQECPRLLSSCPEACMMLAKKAEILGLLKHPGYNVNAAITSGRILKHEPNLSVEFVNHFFQRAVQVKELEQLFKNSEPILTKLRKEQSLLTYARGEYQAKLDKVQAETDLLTTSFHNIHNHLCKLAGKTLKLPHVLKPKHAKESKAKLEESTKLLNAIVHGCSTCQSTGDQHLMTQCAICKNFYHLACVDPPLLRMPKKSDRCIWQCTECDSSDESGSDNEIQGDSVDTDGVRRMKRIKKEPGKFASDTIKEKAKESIKRKSSTSNDINKGKKKKVTGSTMESNTKINTPNSVTKMESSKDKNIKSTVTRRSRKSKEPPPQESFEDCCVCKKNGDKKSLVRCDQCKKCYHFQTCLDPPYSKSPKGKFWGWICEDCDESGEEDTSVVEIAEKTDEK